MIGAAVALDALGMGCWMSMLGKIPLGVAEPEKPRSSPAKVERGGIELRYGQWELHAAPFNAYLRAGSSCCVCAGCACCDGRTCSELPAIWLLD